MADVAVIHEVVAHINLLLAAGTSIASRTLTVVRIDLIDTSGPITTWCRRALINVCFTLEDAGKSCGTLTQVHVEIVSARAAVQTRR